MEKFEIVHEILNDHEIMLMDLIYFVKRVREGTIKSKKTYARYVNTIEGVTGKSIDEVLIKHGLAIDIFGNNRHG